MIRIALLTYLVNGKSEVNKTAILFIAQKEKNSPTMK